jgi:ribosomal protein L37AE/L43A
VVYGSTVASASRFGDLTEPPRSLIGRLVLGLLDNTIGVVAHWARKSLAASFLYVAVAIILLVAVVSAVLAAPFLVVYLLWGEDAVGHAISIATWGVVGLAVFGGVFGTLRTEYELAKRCRRHALPCGQCGKSMRYRYRLNSWACPQCGSSIHASELGLKP